MYLLVYFHINDLLSHNDIQLKINDELKYESLTYMIVLLSLSNGEYTPTVDA